MNPLHELTAVEAAQAIAAGTITSEALVTACLERITAREESVRAWEYLAPEAGARYSQARTLSSRAVIRSRQAVTSASLVMVPAAIACAASTPVSSCRGFIRISTLLLSQLCWK